MGEVYVNEFPGPFGLREDGRLSLAPLELYPASIKIQVLGLVEPDGTTERSWTGLLHFLIDHGHGTKELGTQANPLQVAGNPMSGWFAVYILCSIHRKLNESVTANSN